MTKQAEEAVRLYLESLLIPGATTPEVEKLEQELEAETDVIKIAKLHQALRDEREGTKVKEGFIVNAKAWADTEGIDAKTLENMGVPSQVLSDAGFSVALQVEQKVQKERKTRVTTEDVERSLNSRRKGVNVTIPQLVSDTGASNATVTKVVKAFVEQGKLKDAGPDESHEGRGRAPTLYERI